PVACSDGGFADRHYIAGACDGAKEEGCMSNTEPRVEVRPDRRSVLPWRRHHVDVEVAPLVAAYRDRHRKADTALIERALRWPGLPPPAGAAGRGSRTSPTRSAWR